jgi:hypothetical protein
MGFIVHEWGTNTLVVGSDGSAQRGLHHEEEDLPPFVYDRMKAAKLPGATSVEVKMETPITYFYSDVPLSVKVAIDFPKGVFTQWYPAVAGFYPNVAKPQAAGQPDWADPVLDVDFPFQGPTCAAKYGAVANGLLDWGTVQVLGRDEDVSALYPLATTKDYTWGYARKAASNAVRVEGVPGASEAQHEGFLFYRGLGNFEPAAKVTASLGPEGYDGGVTVHNTDPAHALGPVFVLHVHGEKGGFAIAPEGVAADGSVTRAVGLAELVPFETYIPALAKAMTSALDAAGLYHDEAVAMVETWQRQWFTTPGVRVLYLAPQAWTDAQIPLHVVPAPESVLRVMVMRVELITPAEEAVDLKRAGELGSTAGNAGAVAHFAGLGRFAEPRLRRAMAQLGPTPAAEALLATLATAETRVAAGE